jgi:L-glyceraldehyde reductase
VIHWPIAFTPGQGLFPPHPSIAGEVEIDNSVTLVDTWKAMLKLPKSKVRDTVGRILNTMSIL